MAKFWKEWGRWVVVVFCVLVIAFIFRVCDLKGLPIFGDEAIYIRWAQIMRVEPSLRFVPLSDGKQPLFMWSVIPLLKIFSNPLLAGRLVSVIAGLGSCMGVFVLSYLLFENKPVSVVAMFIYAVSPFSMFFDRLALVDSMLAFFGLWTLIFSLVAAKKVRLDAAMIAGFFLGGALLTKSPGVFFALLIPSVLIFTEWPKGKFRRFEKLSIFVFLFSFTYAIGFGMYNILRLGPEFHMIGLRNTDYVYPLSHVFQRPFDPLLPFLDRTLGWFWKLGPSVFVILVFTGIYINLRKYLKEILLLGAWGFIPLVVSAEYAKVFTARYIYFVFPYFVVLAAVSYSKFSFKSWLWGKSGLVIKSVFVIFVLHALLIDYLLINKVEAAPLPRTERSGYLEEWTAGTGIYEVSTIIRKQYSSHPDQKIVVGTEGHFGTLPNGMQVYLNDLGDITIIGTGLDFKEVPSSLVDSKNAGNVTYFVVNSTRLNADYKKLNLKLVRSFPKAKRPDGSQELLYFFEVLE